MRVRFTPEAFAQIVEICAYISQENPSAARKVRQRIDYVAALLADHPEMGKVISDDGVRMLVIRPYPYLLFYRLTDDEVMIVSVYHGARRRPAFHEPAIEFRV